MEKNERVWFVLFLFCLLVLVPLGAFLGGAWTSCHNGGGEMVKLSCVELDVLGVCEFENEYYVEEQVNWSGWEVTV